MPLISVNSGVTLLTQYENFNNILSPSKGVNIELNLRSYFKFLGSDANSQKLTFSSIGYVPVMDRWVSGFSLESNFASQITPFFMLPYLNLRGVPAMRFQGEFTLLAETEQYVRVYKRWGPDSWAFYIVFGSAWLR